MQGKWTWMFIFAQGKQNSLITGRKQGSVNKTRAVARVSRAPGTGKIHPNYP